MVSGLCNLLTQEMTGRVLSVTVLYAVPFLLVVAVGMVIAQ